MFHVFFLFSLCFLLTSSLTFTNFDGTAYNVIDFSSSNPSLSPSVRAFYAYVPQSLRTVSSPTVIPLFIGLHGSGGNGESFASYSKLMDVAEATGEFVFVAPSGICEGSVTGTTCQHEGRDFNDPSSILFLEELIFDLTRRGSPLPDNPNLLLDPNNVFLTGHSQGAFLSYAYVQVSSGKAPVRTIAPYAGHAGYWFHYQSGFRKALFSSNLFVTFGTDDTIVVMEPNLSNSLTLWFTDVLNCSTVTQFSDLDASTPITDCADSYTMTTYSTPSCPSSTSYTVESVVIQGLGHDWPGGYYPQNVCPTSTPSTFLSGHTTWGQVIWSQIKQIGFGSPADAEALMLGNNGVMGNTTAAVVAGVVLTIVAVVGLVGAVVFVGVLGMVIDQKQKRGLTKAESGDSGEGWVRAKGEQRVGEF